MLFNSAQFIFLFLPLVLWIYWTRPPGVQRKLVLVASSYVFYGAWSWKFAALMFATTSVDYFAAHYMVGSERRRKAWLWASLGSNLGVLAIFKYFDFFASSVNRLAGDPLLPLLEVALPIGISFYTFESMSYVIDVYRGRVKALDSLLDYVHFVTMFPRLVAGPIVRYIDLETQLKSQPLRLTADAAAEAVHFFVLGMAKKVLIADPLARNLVDPVFSAGGYSFATAWQGALGYTAQLYFDFSGYSDMAMGLGLLVGFRLPRNFNLPYRALTISDFWRRWHISLSTWLRDYLYIPLGGNRAGAARVQANLFLTMLLGGLWHGANWTFVLWGAWHGAALVVDRASAGIRRWPAVVERAVTLLIVVVGWVLFRAESVRHALVMLRAMFDPRGLFGGPSFFANPWTWFLVAALALSVAGDTADHRPVRPAFAVVLAVLFVLICLTQLSKPSPFLYYQF